MIGDAHLVYLFVTDMERAIAFYRDTLELPLEYGSGDEWAQFSAGTLKLALHGTAHADLRPGGTVAFTVTDLDASKAKLVDRGVTLGHEGGGERLGPRFVEFADPDGNVLALFEYEEHRA
jgi:catechol 2,3-dioxygenase-like lactoylglutathione lyase family enzyme